ncbi:hypothetical protein LYNGBM3L_59960 [Moorena producens 3L]|uniref:Uncharacterized protein n=1 Tax=Moorena producens 3L TaxID=489825 RepID=F4Y079_9CYAN|nr:hypothetical protein LYNGBM3L_59960 [Moorena producens 3L]
MEIGIVRRKTSVHPLLLAQGCSTGFWDKIKREFSGKYLDRNKQDLPQPPGY